MPDSILSSNERFTAPSCNAFHVLLGALVLAAGALAAAVWRGVDELAAQEAARQAELKNFHARLLGEIGTLAEKSGMLTSADLCPVRFRLRFPDGISQPANWWHARLLAATPDATPIDRSGPGGIAEFGLNPPGRYQLELSLTDSCTLRHNFEILPGVPIDRLVLCPHASPRDLAVAVEVVWPEGFKGERLVAVCDVERDAMTLGEWTWQPDDPAPVRVVATTAEGTAADEDVGWLLEASDRKAGEIVRRVPYRFCRVRGISVYRRGTERSEPPARAAQCAFGNAGRIGNQCYGEEGAVVCAGPAPAFQWDGSGLDPLWRIPAPDELVAELQRSGNDDADSASAADAHGRCDASAGLR